MTWKKKFMNIIEYLDVCREIYREGNIFHKNVEYIGTCHEIR